MSWTLFPTKRPTISKTTLDLLILFALMANFYLNPFLIPTKVSYGGDGFSLFLPAMNHYRETLFQGIIPLWNPYTWMGCPFLATYQPAVLYPPQLISLFFKSSAAALNCSIFISLVWLCFGSYLFGVRALRLERFPSMVMAVALACSGFVGAHTDHVNQLAAVSWIPWIMAEALVLLMQPRKRSVVFLALCVGMQVLAGHPQYVVYTLTYLGGLIACYSVYLYHRRKAEDPPAWLGIVLLLIGIALGIGLGGAQLVPSAELGKLSVRELDSPERKFAFSYPPRHLITLVYPQAFGNPATGLHRLGQEPDSVTPKSDKEDDKPFEYNYSEVTNYLGIVTFALAVLAVLLLFREFLVRCFLVLALISLLISFGDNVGNGVFYELATMWFPGREHLRVPARFMIFFDLSLVVLAAVGFNQVVFYLQERRRITATTLAPLRFLILIVLYADLFLFSQSQVFRFHDSVDILKLKGPVWTFFEKNPGRYKIFRQMLEVPYTTDENNYVKNSTQKAYATSLQIRRLQPNLNMLGKFEVDMGYEEGLLPTTTYLNFMNKFRRNFRSATPDTTLLGLLNIKYILADKPTEGERLKRVLGEDHPTGNLMEYYQILENQEVSQRVMWGDHLRKYFDLRALDATTTSSKLAYRPGDEPVMGYRLSNFAPPLVTDKKKLDIFPITGSPNGLQVSKSKNDSGELIMTSPWYPGWVCKYGDRTVNMQRVNSMMMGCKVPVSASDIRIVFEPFSYRLGLFVSCFFAMLISFAAVLYGIPPRLPRRRRA